MELSCSILQCEVVYENLSRSLAVYRCFVVSHSVLYLKASRDVLGTQGLEEYLGVLHCPEFFLLCQALMPDH